MPTLTDPARELGEIVEQLLESANVSGEAFLAKKFGVDVWSTDFVKILACILERADLVARIVAGSGMDDDHRLKALAHLSAFKAGFTGSSLRKTWNEAGHGLTAMKDHGGPIQFLSQTVRPRVSYPKLTPDEVNELISSIDTYLQEVEASDEEPAFVRQAIIDGLSMFRFQLDKIGWMGSGYALAAFREVIFVYERSEQAYAADGNPDPEAFLGGFLTILKSFQAKIDEAKGWKDTAEAVRDAYQLTSSIVTPVLLTHQFLLSGS